MYIVYILYSESHNRFYIGQTDDFKIRLTRHNAGMEKSTKPYIPWTEVCALQKPTRSEAVKLERKLKNLNTEDLLKFIAKYAADWSPGSRGGKA